MNMIKWLDKFGNIEIKIIIWKENIYYLIVEGYFFGWEEKDNLDRNLNVLVMFRKVVIELIERL